MQQSLFSEGPRFDVTPKSVVAFDIEIANEFDLAPGEDLEKYAPFDISVAAAATEKGDVKHWFARDAQGVPARCIDRAMAHDMLTFLRDAQKKGSLVCAWNGMAFDVRWIGHVADDMKLAAEVALDLYDPMFQFVAKRGFPIGLASVADGLGIVEKKLMAGADAPKEWARGNHQLVIDYVAGDCRMTCDIVTRIIARREIRWRTKKGTISSESMPALRKVRDVMRDPPPDQSWMDKPKPWESWFSWIAPYATKS
jgi:hypothetical protein